MCEPGKNKLTKLVDILENVRRKCEQLSRGHWYIILLKLSGLNYEAI